MSARENDTKEYRDIDSEVSGKSGRPENAKTAACPSKPESESAEQKIARLEKELREARLRADFYDEMINVAEKKFDIQIRKKAGAKQERTCMHATRGNTASSRCADCLA